MTPSLCRNRPESFGPHSSLHPQLPTTCFLDVVVVPLATWIFLAVLSTLLPTQVNRRRRRRASSVLKPTKPIAIEPERAKEMDVRPPRPALATRVLDVLYYGLVVALLAMVSLEIARLAAARLGVGLLPVTYAGVLAALACRVAWKDRVARLANAAFWAMLAAAMALKLAAEAEEGSASRPKGVGVQGKYPLVDEMTDVGVMVGVEVVLAALEFVGWSALLKVR